MAQTFECPSCEATYPFREVLIGRPVRCTTCRKPFRLGEDGIARPVVTADSTTAPAESAAAPAEPAAAPAESTAATAAEEIDYQPDSDHNRRAALSSDNDTSSMARRRTTTNKHRQLASTVSKTLSQAAAEALQSESVKRESARVKREASTARRRSGGGQTKDLGPAVLTGTGEAEARNTRQWLIGCGVLLALVVVGLFFIGSRSETGAALARYGERQVGQPQERLMAHRRRSWLQQPLLPVLTDIEGATIEPAQRYDLRPVHELLEQAVVDARYLVADQLRGWVDADQAEQARAILRDPRYADDVATQRSELDIAQIDLQPPEVFLQNLRDAGLADAAVELLDRLLHVPGPPTGDADLIRRKFLAGDLPDWIELAVFHGEDAMLMEMRGGTDLRTTSGYGYRGRLLRFVGPDWIGFQADKFLDRWNLLEIEVTKRPGIQLPE